MPSPKRAPYFELERDFIDPKIFYESLISNDINFFTGVPDSLLKDFCGIFFNFFHDLCLFINLQF